MTDAYSPALQSIHAPGQSHPGGWLELGNDLLSTGGELSIEGDPDAEAIDVAWFPLDDAQSHLTFPNERRIAQVAWERLAGAQ